MLGGNDALASVVMFADKKTALRVEHAEAAVMRAMVEDLVGSERAPQAFVRELGRGMATYVRADSPLNKVIGVGLDGRSIRARWTRSSARSTTRRSGRGPKSRP